jgi:hypothetical protein
MARASTVSNRIVDWRIIVAISALLAAGLYVMISALTFRVGFPLDDTWIHLTYARNFADHGEWAFRLGEKSAGSTSPLWTFLLSLGYMINLAPYGWTFFLGWIVLATLAIIAETNARRLIPSYVPHLPWIGIFFTFAWHLTWSAVSGMETLLHGLLVFVVLSALLNASRRYLTLGLLTGLSVWVRPDGLTLLGPIIFTTLLTEKNWRTRGRSMLTTLIGFGALLLPYLLFNLAVSGNPLPNTFYAKQAEYRADWLGEPLTTRLTEYIQPVIASPFIVLLPGIVLFLGGEFRRRNWGAVAGFVWILGYFLLYFTRLPPYQHGRYIIPSFPYLYFLGLLGMAGYLNREKLNSAIARFWKTLFVVLVFLFTLLGASQYAKDVYWVESEMVATAEWANQNLPPDALLAVHDIGAMGYFARNPLVDLAGLANPEVIPFIRDESRLAEYLDEKRVDFLVTPPGFYSSHFRRNPPVFVAGGSDSIQEPDAHMQVSPWR